MAAVKDGADWSTLVVVWFQEESVPLINATNEAQMKANDWNGRALDERF